MAHTVTWENNGIYRKFTQQITGEEILRSNFDLHNDPRFLSAEYVLNDFSEITDHDIIDAHTRVYASTDDIISDNKGPLKIAMIVTSDDQVALVNSYKQAMLNDKFHCEMFETLEQARFWVMG